MLSVSPKASELMTKEPAQASEFILNRCIIYRDNLISSIKNDILFANIPYTIDDEVKFFLDLSW